MAKTKKLKVQNGGNPTVPDDGVAVIGTKAWRSSVPLHLQKPLAKALRAMDENDIPNACIFFGECMNLCQSEHEAKPILFFGAQVTGQRWMELRGAAPDHPHIKEWMGLTEMLLRGAVEYFPEDAVPSHNLGRFLQDTGRPEEALAIYRHVMLLDPTQVETYGNAADLYYQAGDRAKAYELWEKAVSLETDKASGRLSQAYYWLRTGQYEKGWAAFNDRWKDLVFVRGYGRQKELGGIHWQGEPLKRGESLFLHGEQGLGDHIQFARYIPVLAERGVTVCGLETRGVLKRWMEASFPDLPIFARDVDDRPSFTHHCSTMDLPGVLGTTVETVPPPVAPGIGPLKRLEDVHHNVDFGDIEGLAVGIAWEGAKGNAADNIRSIPHEQLIHLADIPGVTWVSLQFGENAALIGRSWLGKNFVDGTDGCTDFLDTAAVMRGLDLIVTVDTSTAHAAATLGCETWILHRFAREWRWSDSGERTPWYPAARLFTQSAPNDWRELLLRVRAELEAKANE